MKLTIPRIRAIGLHPRQLRMASSHNINPADLNGTLPIPGRTVSNSSPAVLEQPLQKHGDSPPTGFFRDGYCRPSSQDPAAHTLAGIVTKEFLEYSKSQGTFGFNSTVVQGD